jgi:RimJ/RimL family protein N-acetyltransferase
VTWAGGPEDGLLSRHDLILGRPLVTVLGDRWTFSGPPTVHLVRLDTAVIDALAARDLVGANAHAPFELGGYFIHPESTRVWEIRSAQIRAEPRAARWTTRAIWDPERHVAVGKAGFHGPPDAAGMVEVGYSVDPRFRRQGYAKAALSAMLEQAATEESVRTVRASIRPDNEASLALVAQFSFVEVGEQWDDEDGLETIYELPLEADR